MSNGEGRRDFLDRCLRLGAGAAVLGALAPVPCFLDGPAAEAGAAGGAASVCPESDLKPGQAKLASYRGRPALVLRGQNGLKAFSAVCTHLGCAVKWDEKEKAIRCPCHGARFDAEGAVTRGPARNHLAPIPVAVKNSAIVLGG